MENAIPAVMMKECIILALTVVMCLKLVPLLIWKEWHANVIIATGSWNVVDMCVPPNVTDGNHFPDFSAPLRRGFFILGNIKVFLEGIPKVIPKDISKVISKAV